MTIGSWSIWKLQARERMLSFNVRGSYGVSVVRRSICRSWNGSRKRGRGSENSSSRTREGCTGDGTRSDERRYPMTSIRRRRRIRRNKSAYLRKKSQLRGWRRRYPMTSIRRRRRRRRYKSAYLRKKSQLSRWRRNDVDSEAPADTKKQVGVSSVATEGMTEVGLSIKEIVLLTKILVSEHVTVTVTLNHRSVMAWLRNRNFESPFRDDMATQP